MAWCFGSETVIAFKGKFSDFVATTNYQNRLTEDNNAVTLYQVTIADAGNYTLVS